MQLEYQQEEAVIRRRYRLVLAGMFLALAAAGLFSFAIGYYPLTPQEVFQAFLSRFGAAGEIKPQAVTIFWSIRLPRILSALFIGASLSVAGATYQGMFRNPWSRRIFWGSPPGPALGPPLLFCAAPPTGSFSSRRSPAALPRWHSPISSAGNRPIPRSSAWCSPAPWSWPCAMPASP